MTPPRTRVRMSGSQRREQLIHIGRAAFAERGFVAATVDEIAVSAGVTKPVVYEHFGGKEGLYAVIVDRKTRAMLDHIAGALVDDMPPRALFEKAVVALLEYISDNPDGFRVMVRDAPSWHSTGSLASLMSDIATQIEHELSRVIQRRDIAPVSRRSTPRCSWRWPPSRATGGSNTATSSALTTSPPTWSTSPGTASPASAQPHPDD